MHPHFPQPGEQRKKDRAWCEKEISYLETHFHKQSVECIAHVLGRTPIAVKLKAKRLGIRKTSEGYTIQEISLALGCDHRRVERWIRLGWLKGTRRQSHRVTKQGGDFWHFSRKDLQRFVREHSTDIDQRRVDKTWFADLAS